MRGVRKPNNVVQFKAVPYATLPGRFKQSVLLNDLGKTDRDFTKPGAACPQIFPSRIHDGGPIPEDNISTPPLSNEFTSLILQLNVPLSTLQAAPPRKLPILVYIHGGGFVLGHIDNAHSTALMTEQSIADAQPVISASIQYRLGALGSLYIPEAGTSNRGLNDQRNALLWLQRFVSGFGGDSSNVTVFGESAGALSICDHMLSKPPQTGPLFRRVILMSGILGPATLPHSIDFAKAIYDRFLAKMGIHEKGVEGLEKLREADVERIVQVTAEIGDEGIMWWPVWDEEWFGEGTEGSTCDRAIEMVAECEWVDEVVLGTTGFEGSYSMGRFANITPQEGLDGIEGQVTHLSSKPSKKVYRYIFDVRNPFPNHSLYQLPHHWVDVYFVFKTFQFRYPTKRLKYISTRHAQLWVDFANGKAPWAKYNYEGSVIIIVADDREGWVERSAEVCEEVMDLSWDRYERLIESWKGMGGVERFWPLKAGGKD
ncbi:unnamed protein product [Periconia digitata]|uniref:Carboxylic ester hydrolase n=1 Tax=Periconia digitata TaxID=1303443 RepID=A0A9W4U5X9_9PLEO|nr:unnamed protein product [Periconia digitata]